MLGSSFSQSFLIDELGFFFAGDVTTSRGPLAPPGSDMACVGSSARRAQLLSCAGAWCGLSLCGEDRCPEGTGVSPAAFLSATSINPGAPEHPSTGFHRQREGAPRAMPSRYRNLKHAAKQSPAFVLILLLYCLLLYKRLQFKMNRSDSQLMWYSGRPEFLLLWQWSSAHLFCR